MNIQSVNPYLPSFNADGVRNTEKEAPVEVHLPTRQQAAIDALLGPETTDEARTRCYQILQVFPAGVLENLKVHGLKVIITQGQAIQGVTESGNVALGGYAPLERTITFDQAVLMTKLGRHVTTHEMIHAIDHMREERKNGRSSSPVLASTEDKEALAIYSRYTGRGAVEFIDQLRWQLKKPDGSMPNEGHLDTEDNWGKLSVDYKREKGKEMFRIDQQPKASAEGILQRMAEKAAGAITVTRDLPTTEVDVDMLQGKKAHVIQEGLQTLVVIPEGASAYTGDVWSDYAHRSGQVCEYVAEAFSQYLEGGSKRADLKDFDPDMYAYTEKTLQQEFNLRP